MTRDIGALRAALASALPDGDRITGVRAFSTGHSNETYLIEGLDRILRLPPTADPLMPGSHGVIAQARIYRALAAIAGAPPVPEVLMECAERSLLGDEFYVMARVAGEEVNDYQPQDWFTDALPEERDAICRTWMTSFGQLANLGPIDVLGPAMTPEDQAGRWRRVAMDADCAPLVELFDRLLRVPAPRTGVPSPVHGDPKLANLMWSDGELTAVLDWELAYNGEPLADLGYMLFFFASDAHPANRGCGFPGMWPRDRIIAHWAGLTGRSSAGVHWHEIAAAGKMAAIIAYGHHLYVSGKSNDARFLQWKIPLDKNLKLIDDMLAAAQR